MKQRNPKKGWTPNWSSRGTAMLNLMEMASEFKRPVKANASNHQLAIAKKLALLAAKYPENNFYKSLIEQSKNKPLSPNQVRCIAKDFGIALKSGSRYA